MKLNKTFASVCCVIALCLSVILSGCTAAPAALESSDKPAVIPAFVQDDAVLLYGELSVRPGDNAAPILDLLGTDYTYSESVSCSCSMNGIDGKDGMDKFFDYDDVSITTSPLLPGNDYITSVEVWGGSQWSTSRGIGIGSTLDEVLAAYGTDYLCDSSMYIYYANNADHTSTQLYFIIEDGIVSILGIA